MLCPNYSFMRIRCAAVCANGRARRSLNVPISPSSSLRSASCIVLYPMATSNKQESAHMRTQFWVCPLPSLLQQARPRRGDVQIFLKGMSDRTKKPSRPPPPARVACRTQSFPAGAAGGWPAEPPSGSLAAGGNAGVCNWDAVRVDKTLWPRRCLF